MPESAWAPIRDHRLVAASAGAAQYRTHGHLPGQGTVLNLLTNRLLETLGLHERDGRDSCDELLEGVGGTRDAFTEGRDARPPELANTMNELQSHGS